MSFCLRSVYNIIVFLFYFSTIIKVNKRYIFKLDLRHHPLALHLTKKFLKTLICSKNICYPVCHVKIRRNYKLIPFIPHAFQLKNPTYIEVSPIFKKLDT